jgi:uncharacterized protein (DUF1499 family)
MPLRRTALAWTSLLLALACGVAALLAGAGYRMAWWSLGAGIGMIRWAATAALGAAALGLVAAGLAYRVGAGRAVWIAVVALVAGLAVATPPMVLWRQAQQLPHIHDISTDTDHPPAYVAVVPLRKGARNPVDYQATVAPEQKRGYADIVPLDLPVPPEQAFARAERAARAMGWEIVAVSPQDGRIEATDTTLLFGFKDDVVVRVAAQAGGSRVDVRSLSRVGGSDFGVNAKRVRAYLKRLGAETGP